MRFGLIILYVLKKQINLYVIRRLRFNYGALMKILSEAMQFDRNINETLSVMLEN